MARPRTHLERAPIVEAVIDLRVLPRDDVNTAALRDELGEIGVGYVRAEPLRSFEARLVLKTAER